MNFQKILKNFLYKRINIKSTNNQNDGEASSVIVFSPHFDDETLGCGGTIIRKIKAGANVRLVFMTDGSKSHAHAISEKKLKLMRQFEGRLAAKSLGIDAQNVFLLNLVEGQLHYYLSEARSKVSEILESFKPDEVFIPHRKEPRLWSSDHRLTNQIVSKELKRISNPLIIYEYPIWYWFHWPWVSIDLHQRQYLIILLRLTLKYNCGLRSIFDLNSCISIKDELNKKEKALKKHKSQTTQMFGKKDWNTLYDIAGGDFMGCFFQDFEYFYKTYNT